jgi:hypothetical protein
LGAADFTLHVDGNNPSPADFPGSESGIDVSLAPGPYAVTETKPTIPSSIGHQYNSDYSSDCTGTISAGQTKTCTVTDTRTAD